MKKSLVGLIFGDLVVIEYCKNSRYICLCVCGRKIKLYKLELEFKKITHCGCKYLNFTKCEICERCFKNIAALSKHLYHSHIKEISKQEYFLKYLSKNPNQDDKCLLCNNPTSFRGLGCGFLNCCSVKCSLELLMPKNDYNKGRKQSNETIRKRVEKIDYKDVMEKRKITMLNKYGCDNYAKTTEQRAKLSKNLKGKKNPRKNKEHQSRIIESKRKNNTLKHKIETKNKIRELLLKYYSNPNIDISYCIKSSYTYGKSGHCNGLYFRSSYERDFILYCLYHNIKIESAENKNFVVLYMINDKLKRYYPDFYLIELNLIVEIKSNYSYAKDIIKINSGRQYFERYLVLTQDEIYDPNFNIKDFVNKEKIDQLFEKQAKKIL